MPLPAGSAGTGKGTSFDDPPQIMEDLAVFGLSPPVTLDQIRTARNREIRKYHSDRFVNDAERLETSKRIMQIYNTAYERLEAYYKTK